MRGSARGFSLVEVVLAMGVATLAFTTIIGLFPLGLNMSKESHEETQAALIAQSLLSDLRDDFPGRITDGRNTSSSNRLTPSNAVISLANFARIPAGPLAAVSNSVIYIGFSNYTVSNNNTVNPGETSQAGAIHLRPVAGAFITSNTTNLGLAPVWYRNGSNGLAAVVQMVIRKTFPISAGGAGTLSMADIRVETPGTAPLSNRTVYPFSGGFR